MIGRAMPKIGAICAVAAMLAISGTALAYFSATGTGTASAAVTQLGVPTINSATAATGGTVALNWKAVTAPGAETVTYYVTRNGEAAGGNCPGPAEPGTALTCTDSGLEPGTYSYKVTAAYSTWSKASPVLNATVSVGPVAKFAIAGTPSSAAAGAAISLTITAQDAAGGKVTTFTGTHSLVFSGAPNSPSGTVPSVTNASGTAVSFGTATALTFATGSTTVSSGKNGALKAYKVGEASITATEGSLTTPVPLTVTITPGAASKFVLTAAGATPTAGTGDNLTINTFDAYGNAATNYTGSHSIVFSGASAAPAGTLPTVDDSSGNPVAFGTATPIVFTAGVATVSEGGNGETTLYKAGATTIKAAEGSTVTTTTGVVVTVAAAAAASLTTTTSLATEPTTTGFTLTLTAKDVYGNTATSYTGERKITFTGTGTAAETSPGGSIAGVINNAGTTTPVPLGTPTPITFTNGAAVSASSKNGYLRLYKPGTASITASDGTFTAAPLAVTVTIGAAKRVAFSGLTASAGTVSSTCFFTCTITTLGNAGTVSANLMITDEYGNTVSAVGASKTVAVAATGTTGSTVAGSPLALPETGPAITAARFTYTAPTSGSFTNTLTASSTGYTSATATTSK
jgi:hypothetical protein